MTFKLLHGDCRKVIKTLDDSSIDAIVTDPPYELGFMGKSWDSSGVACDVGLWSEALRVLKPGGHILAFSGTRTYHRMVCAIEDAGFEIRDQIGWVYGSGFPKSHDVSKAIDKEAGAVREVIGINPNSRPNMVRIDATVLSPRVDAPLTAPATPEAQQWQGWGTALKPAHEPICVARKPLIGTVAANVMAHGTGALNIDGCRVETNEKLGGGMVSKGRPKVSEGWDRPWMHDNKITERKKLESIDKVAKAEALGRWPANIIHDGSDEVLAVFPNAGGSAARFFYCAKASKADRQAGDTDNTHPTVKPTDLMRYLCRLITPPGGTVLDPFTGSGSTGRGAVLEGFDFIGIEMTDEYLPIAQARIEDAESIFKTSNWKLL